MIGSPYCVRDYVVDERFGGPEALAAARAQLADRGLALILDYVPNHVAPDHPWTARRPECLLTGTEEELARHPEAFLRTAGGVVANGRDPYFPPWPDVVQLNAFSPALRDAVTETLIALGAQCDGLRCDMAMLMTNEVFARTWGERAGPAPREYWPTLIGAQSPCTRTWCSSPRRTGTWSGRCSSRASTSVKTTWQEFTTGSSRTMVAGPKTERRLLRAICQQIRRAGRSKESRR